MKGLRCLVPASGGGAGCGLQFSIAPRPITLLHFIAPSPNSRQWTYKGTVAVRLGEFEEADDAFSESLRLQPTSHVTYTKRSEVRLLLGDPDAALADANRALALKPVFVRAYLAKSGACSALADLDGARVALEQGLQVARGDGLLTAALDQVRARVRERQETIEQRGGDLGNSRAGTPVARPPSARRKATGGRSSRHTGSASSGRYGSARRSGSVQSLSELDGAGGSHHGSSFDPRRRGTGRALMSAESRALSCRSLSSAASAGTFGSSVTSTSKTSMKGEPYAPRQVPSKAIRAKGKGAGTGAEKAPTKTLRTQSRTNPPMKLSEFVKQNRAELREQMKLVRAKLDLIDLLAKSSNRQKLDLLFGLIDSDQTGAVDTRELIKLLRSRNQLLSIDETFIGTLRMAKAYDADVNAELNRDEFDLVFQRTVQHMDVEFDELAEYLSLELSFATGNISGRAGIGCGEYDEESESTSTSESDSSSSFHQSDDDPAEPPYRPTTPRCPPRATSKFPGQAATSALRRQSSEWSLEYANRELVPLSPTPATVRLAVGSTSGGAVPVSSGTRTASSARSSGAQGVPRASRASSVALPSSSWH